MQCESSRQVADQWREPDAGRGKPQNERRQDENNIHVDLYLARESHPGRAPSSGHCGSRWRQGRDGAWIDTIIKKVEHEFLSDLVYQPTPLAYFVTPEEKVTMVGKRTNS